MKSMWVSNLYIKRRWSWSAGLVLVIGVACLTSFKSFASVADSDNSTALKSRDSILNSVEFKATDIAANDNFTCALLIAGQVKCWGEGGQDRLAGYPKDRSIPALVDGFVDAVAIAVGRDSACALLRDATVSCWGGDFHDDGSYIADKNSLIQYHAKHIVGLARVSAITMSGRTACALLEDARVKCWGANSSGELGNGTTKETEYPTYVTGLSHVASVKMGRFSACAVLKDGHIKCWGASPLVAKIVQLDDKIPRSYFNLSPVAVEGIAQAKSVAMGWDHVCALLAGGKVKCWGKNNAFQLGRDGPDSKTAVVTNDWSDDLGIVPLAQAGSLVSGIYTTCAVVGAQVHCWGERGWNPALQILMDEPNARQIPQLDGLTDIVMDETPSICGLTTDKSVQCADLNPKFILKRAVKLVAGSSHMCALLDAGEIRCWGRNNYGQLGGGFLSANETLPVKTLNDLSR
jgi:hypothetical protein